MKKLIYSLTICLAVLGAGCHNGRGHLSINTTDSNTEFKFEAKYDEHKTRRLENYLDSALKNELPLDQDIDIFVNLNGSDKFNLKAKKGWLQINFDKRKNSLNGYMKVKQLAKGIGAKLTER